MGTVTHSGHKVWCDYIYLDTDERRRFAQQSHEYLIEQVQDQGGGYSGGKAIKGPQSSGILCGKKKYISSVALQSLDLDEFFEIWNPPSNLIDKSKITAIPFL